MLYLSGIHALNIPCALQTCGDWHHGALQWDRPTLADSEQSVFGEYGIEGPKPIPRHTERIYVANHIRALLDLLESGQFGLAQGMNQDFICNDAYTREVFDQVSRLRTSPRWPEIDRFMGREYHGRWLDYTEEGTA